MSTHQQHVDRSNIGFKTDTRVISILNLSPKRDQQIFRTAFIHSATILFVIVCGACALIVYRILEPFLQSILWSILAGAFLFPFKYRFTSIARYHLRQFDMNSYFLFYGLIIILPIQIFDKTIESICSLCIRKWKQLILIIIFLPSIEFLQSGVIYHCITTIGYDYFIIFERYIHIFDSLWIKSFVIIYIFAVLIFYNSSSLIKYILNIFSIPIWFILFIYLSQYLPVNYRLIVLTLAVILIGIGFVIEQNFIESQSSKVDQYRKSIFSIFRCIRVYFHIKSSSSTISSSSSTFYFTFILWTLVAIKVYQFYQYLIPISIFIIIYKFIKYILLYTYSYLSRQKCIEYIIYFWKIRRDVFTPPLLRSIIRILIKGDKKINHVLQESIDYLVSAIIIVTLFVIILFGSIILVMQIHDESIHMIKLTSNLVNETIVLQYMLPDKEHMSHLIDKTLNKLYVFGRNWITIQIAKVQPPRVEIKCCLPINVITNESIYINVLNQNSLSNKQLEEQILQLWDYLYTYITNTSILFIRYKNSNKILYSSSNQNFHLLNFLIYIQKNFNLHINDFYHLIFDNLDLLHSIWLNITIILTLISTIISLLFTSSFVLLNFFISFIVFITLLFYLLSYSDQLVYQPTIWLNNILSIGNSSLGKTINDVITSVFIASLKIATFYGLYTYVLHTLLGSNFVFLPAVIASICAVTLQSYWAALPGCFDLWFVQQRPLSAFILLFAQIVPIYIVDTAIYSEVKGGGHQYLTVLAIAGGVYYRGIEGALIGPIILCCLLVGIRMYNETISSNSYQLSLSLTRNHND
ncbi:unnamed protein product [Rotaria sp. Silwood1]|nr:unnamed protein product [Rotaria sp. Silwood1]